MKRLRELQTEQPFFPYTIRMADGLELRVKHPEFVILNPDGRTVVLVEEDTGRTHMLDTKLMSDAYRDPLNDPRLQPERPAAA